MSSTFLYFAYGSNLLAARLKERTPSARACGVGVLPWYELRWHKEGNDGSGKCDIVHAPTSTGHVQGVVYEIDKHEKPALDAAESLGVGYSEKQLEVQLSGRSVHAWAYMALRTRADVVPFTWYKALVVAGARQSGLDAAYIQALEAVVGKADVDLSREARHRRLLGAA
jgi:cation transport regulator ChaC